MNHTDGKEQTGSPISRRDFLKLAGAGLASLALVPLPPEDDPLQDLFYRVAASKLPEQPVAAPGPEYYSFVGKQSELLGLRRTLTAAEKLESLLVDYPTELETTRRACRELVANQAIWTDGLIQPLADKRRIEARLKEMRAIPWETASADELLRKWFELNRRNRKGLLDAASLEFSRSDTLSAAILRWSGESSGRFSTQLINFSADDRQAIETVLASFPEEILAKIAADPTLKTEGTFDIEYGEPVIRLQSELLAKEIPLTSLEFFKLYLMLAHEFVHGLDIFTNKNLWLVLSPSECLQLVTLRAKITGRYPKLFADPSPFAEPEGGPETGLSAEFIFNSEFSNLSSKPMTFRRLGSRYGWLIAYRTHASQGVYADEVQRLLWTPAGASGNLTAATDAWIRYQTECFAETVAALISLRRLKGLDLTKWHQEPELQYFRLMGKALARQGIFQVPLGEVFRQLKPNVR